MTQPDPTRQRAEAIKIADSLMGYIAHVSGSLSCRHCELAQDIRVTPLVTELPQ